MLTGVDVIGASYCVERTQQQYIKMVLSVGKSLATAANICAKDARKNAPVGTPESTGKKGYVGGQMQNSIRQETFVSRPLRYYVMGVTTNVNYSKYVELGTYKMKAQPFLYPAFLKGVDALFAQLEENGG